MVRVESMIIKEAFYASNLARKDIKQ